MPPGMRAECYAVLRGRSYFFTAAGVELACYPSSIYICGFDGGNSLLHAGVLPHSNVRPSGLGSSCDGENPRLLFRCSGVFAGSLRQVRPCGSIRTTSVPELIRHKFWIVWAVRSYLLHLVQRHLCDV